MTLPLREGIRAVVLDVDDRILLVRLQFTDATFWCTPGGGIEVGETPERAIRRELLEEVGLVDVELGPIIWERTHEFFFTDIYSGQRDEYFLVRTSISDIEPSFSKQELLAEGLTEARWWTLKEIQEASAERFSPSRLASLLEELLTNGPPGTVIDTGI